MFNVQLERYEYEVLIDYSKLNNLLFRGQGRGQEFAKREDKKAEPRWGLGRSPRSCRQIWM